ncbi:FecR family protein [Tangfeifania diversioriginum]|uniref:FecR family protein n=1 Tax=Tangfeifania diversioriginum TaxID=1168035 RepID=A0A1M6MCU3_9BACT|nr:FecR domain-containing protein [Tangfeifania diversioriginum]SHJ81189.1 FecR family protein [Tangfeifania diversioriginum]
MNKNRQHKKFEPNFKNLIEYRKGLTSFDKKLEAAKLIDQTATVDVDKAYRTVSSKINKGNKTTGIFTSLTRIAAVLTLPLLAFTIWTLFFQETNKAPVEMAQNEITWQKIQSPMGMRSQVVLPDGSNLWLNAGSEVKYSIPFTRENREVELAGEAFFDVAKNEQLPFVVVAGDTEVEVLGTQFNVNAYPQTEQIQVALKEGKVKFRFAGDEGKMKFCELNPNDFMEFSKTDKTFARKNTNIEKYIAWHQNVMILDDTPMTELAGMLERWYGVEVVIADEEIKRYKFTTTFDNEPLHRVLELLEISSPEIKINYTVGKPIEGTKKFSPSVVTITKK